MKAWLAWPTPKRFSATLWPETIWMIFWLGFVPLVPQTGFRLSRPMLGCWKWTPERQWIGTGLSTGRGIASVPQIFGRQRRRVVEGRDYPL